jgi:PiT family inorganic phosphate transporter
MEIAIAVIVIIFALAFDFTNGFHDAANAIATAISSRALDPKPALVISALMNLVGSLLGTGVANTIAKSIVGLDGLDASGQLKIVLAGLLGGIAWNLFSWLFGIPTSSSHALIGGLVGAGLAAISKGNSVVFIQWGSVVEKVILPMFLCPLVGFLLAFILTVAIMHIFKNSNPKKAFSKFRFMQIFSSSAISLGHGLQDAQKTMGIIFMASVAVGWSNQGDPIPFWIKMSCALAIALGTYSGGFKIIATLGKKIIQMDPIRGFVAESIGATLLWFSALAVHAPISTTHIVTSSIMGAGATKKLSAVKWGVAKSIVFAWIVTLPAAALMAFIFYLPLSLL